MREPSETLRRAVGSFDSRPEALNGDKRTAEPREPDHGLCHVAHPTSDLQAVPSRMRDHVGRHDSDLRFRIQRDREGVVPRGLPRGSARSLRLRPQRGERPDQSPSERPAQVVFVTAQPCITCAKAIVNSGVSKVYYRATYRSDEGLDVIRKVGIDVERV